MPAPVDKADVKADIQRVAEELDKVPTRNEYGEHGEYSGALPRAKFGSWTAAREAAGLEGGPTQNTHISENEFVRDVRRVANQIGESPSQEQYNDHGQYSHQLAYGRFASWNEALEATGLETERDDRLPDEKLLASVRAVGQQLDRVPSQSDYRGHGEHGLSVLKRRFGSWREAVLQAGFEPRSVGAPTGKENPEWAGGYGHYYGPDWHRKRRRALARDGYECAGCGMAEDEHREQVSSGLEVHHIKPAREFDDYEEMNSLSNLVSLFIHCHAEYEQLPNERAKKLIRWF